MDADPPPSFPLYMGKENEVLSDTETVVIYLVFCLLLY